MLSAPSQFFPPSNSFSYGNDKVVLKSVSLFLFYLLNFFFFSFFLLLK